MTGLRRLLSLVMVVAALGAVTSGDRPAQPARGGVGAHVGHDTDFPGPDLGLGVVLASDPAPAGADVRVTDPAHPGQLAGCTVQSETSLAGFGTDVYVGYNDAEQCQSALAASSGISWTGLSRSTDGGVTFTDESPLPPSGDAANLWGDPVVAVDTTGDDAGTVYLASLCDDQAAVFSICVGTSTDQGATFAWHVVPPTSDNNADKEWIAVDNTGGINDGSLYLTWTDFGVNPTAIKFTKSIDHGVTWSAPRTIGTGSVQGSRPAVGPDGEVNVVWETAVGSNPRIMWARSTNGGTTFATKQAASPVFKPAGHTQVCLNSTRQVVNADIRTLEFPTLAVDTYGSADPAAPDYNPARGSVYVAYEAGGTGDESDVYLVRLTPGSAAFSAPLKVNDDATTTDQWMPEVAAAGPGKVVVSWVDRREDAAAPSPVGDRMMRQYMAVSADGGATFAPNAPLSSATYAPAVTNPNIDAGMAWCYMGDYNGLASDRAGHLLASWGDNRDGMRVSGTTDTMVVPDPNVYFHQADV